MALICEICQLEELNSSQFEDGAQLRGHLVEFHSKFVADALLAPNINDKIHIWLMANIDYSSSSKTAEQCDEDEKCSPQVQEIQADEIMEQRNDDDNFEMSNNIESGSATMNDNNDGNGAALEMLLKGILGQQQVQAVQPPEMQEEGPSTQIANEESNQQLNFFDSLKTLLLTSAEIQQKSGETTPSTSRAALVDSKAIRKAHCQVCNLDICSTARQRHVYMIHLKKKDLFKCKLCDYINSNSMWEVQKHCRMQHGSDIRPISQEEKHKLEIQIAKSLLFNLVLKPSKLVLSLMSYKRSKQMWSQLCFPEWKQKPQKRKLEENLQEEDNKIVEIGEKKKREPIEVEKMATKTAVKKEEMEEEEFGVADTEAIIEAEDADNSGGVNDRLCHLCMEESKYPGRHIAQRHLKQPLYECPICFKFGSYESCTVSKHIQKVHPKSKLTPINNLAKYAQEIRDLQARCFPNRQMKLVRPVNNSGKIRPRERHICGICGTDVAQSDRQRHVFHKHLRKGKIFECPLCDFSSNYDIHRVKWHIKWDHKEFLEQSGGTHLEPISHESEHRDEIDALNEKCFPGWQRKRHISSPAVEDSNVPGTSKNVDETMNNGNDGTTTDLELLEKAMKTVAEAIINQQQREGSSQSPPVELPEERRNANTTALDEWHCQLCRFALKPGTNLLRHIAKDHLNMPLYQCPICENHGAHSAYEVRSHMLRSHGNTKLEPLSSLDENLEEIEKVWRDCFPQKEFKVGMGCVEKTPSVDEMPNPGKPLDEARVRCRECGQEMKTEDRQVHVYRHHLREPRLYECPVCDFSHYACSSDVRNHILRAHKNQSDLMPRANLLRYSKEISEWNERCFPGWINRRLPANLVEDFNSCRLCGMDVRQTSRHIAEHHLCIPLHQCPLCEYGAAEARLVLRHMRNNHTTRECRGLEPISNVEKRRAEFSELHNQCFPGRPKRLSNITIADESRRAKCRGCGMTISKKRRCLHLLEKHLKKQIFKCKYCLFASNHDRSAVEAHQKEKHAGKVCNVVSNLYRHKGELRRLAAECFNEPNIKMET